MSRKHGWKKTLTLASSAAILTTGLVGCTNKVEKITSYFAEQNFEEALNYYKSKIKDKDREELTAALREIILALPEQFAADEIDYELARKTLDTVEAMHLSGMSEDLLVVRAKIQTLVNSKQAWLTAEQAFADGDFLAAAASYERVDPMDPNHEAAVEQIAKSFAEYEASILAQADALATQDDYDAAISLLQEAIPNLEDAAALESRLEEITAAAEEFRLAEERRAVLAEAEEEASNGNLEEALGILDRYKTQSGDSSAELQTLYDQYAADYINATLQQVQEIMDAGEYGEALEILEHARQVAESEQFDALLAEIEAVRPVYLSELRAEERDRFEKIERNETLKDTQGNSYSAASGNLFQLNATKGSWTSEPGMVEYVLNSNYSLLSGVVAVDDESDSVKSELTIEGDGVVLYTLPLSVSTEPTTVSVDISTVNVLKIQLAIPENDGKLIAILSGFYLEK
ncbi:MAG: NPCBM/NEW2 domain-containing protein [Bacillota bacterium]|nr:NPCBM/NEW2 domain-containing protein [Bacillota bacterium]